MIGNISDYNLDGYVYDFRYYNRALSNTEISTIYDSGNRNSIMLGDEVLQLLNGEYPTRLEEEIELINNSVTFDSNYSNKVLHFNESIKKSTTNINRGQTIKNNCLLGQGIEVENINIENDINNNWMLVTEIEYNFPINNPWTGEGNFIGKMSGGFIGGEHKVTGFPDTGNSDWYIFGIINGVHMKMVRTKIVNNIEEDTSLRTAGYTSYSGEITETTINEQWSNKIAGTVATSTTSNGYYLYDIKPSVLIPLHKLSSNNGQDLEIKVEWDNTTSSIYKSDGYHDVDFNKIIRTRYVRIRPEAYNEYTSLRFDVYVDGKLQDHRDGRTVSSFWTGNTDYDGDDSYLSSPRSWIHNGSNGTNGWIKLDMGIEKNVTGIKILPRANRLSQYITQFRLEYSNDNTNWTVMTTTSSRYYKGFYLSDVFNHTRITETMTTTLSYSKYNEKDEWHSNICNQ